MSKITKYALGIIVIAIVVWGLSSSNKPTIDVITSDTGDTMMEEENIKVGMIAPLTGDASVYGTPLSNTLQLAFDQINESGGINGREFELIIQDGQCNGKDAANAMQKLVAEGVQVVIGGFCSSESLSAEPIATANKILLISPASSSPDLTDVSTYFTRTYPSDAAQGSILAELAYNDKGWRRVAFIVEQMEYPLGIYRAFNESFDELGGEVIKEEFAPETADFRTPLTKLRADDVDAFFISVQAAPAADRIFKQLQDIGWDIPLLVSDTVAGDAPTLEKYSDFLEGTLAAEFGIDLDNTKFQDMLKAYEAKFGTEMAYQSYGQSAYDATYLLKEAIEDVGYDATKIAQWLRDVEGWEGVSGMVEIQDNGDRASGHVPKIIQGGKSVLYEAESGEETEE